MPGEQQPWDGIPQNPAQSGWHWMGWDNDMEARYWEAGFGWEFPSGMVISDFSKVEYLGPCQPPVTRCADGRHRVAVSAEFRHDVDQIYIRMNDQTEHRIDGYFWRDDKPVFDIVGKTIPEINAAADEYRRPKQENEAP